HIMFCKQIFDLFFIFLTLLIDGVYARVARRLLGRAFLLTPVTPSFAFRFCSGVATRCPCLRRSFCVLWRRVSLSLIHVRLVILNLSAVILLEVIEWACYVPASGFRACRRTRLFTSVRE